MDVLKNKQYETYTYTSRYATVPFSYNTQDEKYIYHIGANLLKNTSYLSHKVRPEDTLDQLALTYYANPTYYWVIAYFNDIQDCFIRLADEYEVIKIPNIQGIKFGELR